MNISNIIKSCKIKVGEIINTYSERKNEIIESRKNKKEDNTPINLVINSSFNYPDKKLNILKECLNCWSSKNNYIYSSVTFDWIYSDPDMKEKIYFISTTKKELKKFQLYDIIDGVLSNSYMNTYLDTIIYKPSRFRENYLNNSKTYDYFLG